MGVSIVGLGHVLPPPETVAGQPRPRVNPPCGPSDLALDASKPALSEAGWTVDSVQMIVFATLSPDVTFPGAGCYLQHKLGGDTVGSLDIRGQCAGWLMGLSVANDMIACGKFERVLLAAAEVHSSGMDHSDAGLPIRALYADGGSVTALASGSGVAEVAAVACGADGRFLDKFWCEYPSSRQYPTRITVEDVEQGKHFIKIDRDHVSDFGRRKLPESIKETLDSRGQGVEDVDLFVLSHVFPEVAEDAAKALGLAADRFVIAGSRHGHLSAASLPVALDEARDAGRIGQGARVCLAACGAGYAWGAAVLEFA